MNLDNMNIKEYLDLKGIKYAERNGELVMKCLFSDCDADSRPGEAHLYFSAETGQYHCKKCDSRGNLITLAQFFGDIGQKGTHTTTPAIPPKKEDLKAKISPISDEEVEKYRQALPENIRAYLGQRGITDDVIAYAKLGWGEFGGKWWITIPIFGKDGKAKFLKLKKNPDAADKSTPRYKIYPAETKTTLYGTESLDGFSDSVVICEGELDRLVLFGQGIPAITSTAGAATFKNEWYAELAGIKKIYLCLDRDEEGEKGEEKIAGKLFELFPDVEVYKIAFPDRMTEGKDVTDYFTKYGGNPDEFMYRLPVRVKNPHIPERIAKIEEPKRKVFFSEWKETIQGHFPDLAFPAEVCASIATQLLITDVTNPFALVLVDVPSSGKTITLNFFSEIEKLSYGTDRFTPASFVSNSANVKKERLKEIDLLPRLRYKLFLIRDLATLFSKRDDDLMECMGILTRVLDGEGLCTDSGVHGQRQYIGEFLFMVLAASTPIPPKVWKLMGNLGSRLFFINMNTRNKTEEELSSQLTTTEYKQKERACREITKQFLYTLWHQHSEGVVWEKQNDDQETIRIIARCARLLARLRGVINVWKDGLGVDGEEYSYTTPVIEKPDRINQLFYNIARGHALATGRMNIGREDLGLVVELALDSAPTIRTTLFGRILAHGGEITTSQVEEELNCAKPTARKEMKSLMILGLVSEYKVHTGEIGNEEKGIRLKAEFHWFLSSECKQIRGIEISEEEKIIRDAGI